jgi:hypothetical protein
LGTMRKGNMVNCINIYRISMIYMYKNMREIEVIKLFMFFYIRLCVRKYTIAILFTLAFLSVSGYVRTMAMGALDVYGDCHHSIVFLCALVVITLLSYFVDHHQINICQIRTRTAIQKAFRIIPARSSAQEAISSI